MTDCLLIRGRSLAYALDVMPVVTELAEIYGSDMQIDVATVNAYSDYIKLNESVRRVITVETGAVDELTESGDGGEEADELPPSGGGWQSALGSVAKKFGSVMGKGTGGIWKLKEELRLVKYDVVFDFDSNAFSIAIARAAKSEQTIGFDPSHIDRPIPGGHLVYHNTFLIDGEISNSLRMRRLVARFFDHKVQPGRASGIASADRPSWVPTDPYIAVGGRIPKPLTDIMEKAGMPMVSLQTPQTPESLVGFVQHAALVVGNGEVPVMARLLGKKTMYIGNKADVPEGAIYMTTPKELTDTIQSVRPAGARPPAAPAEESPAPAAEASAAPAPATSATPAASAATPAAASDEAEEDALEAPIPQEDSGLKIKLPGKQ